jgi:cytochrome c oxidase subunit III
MSESSSHHGVIQLGDPPHVHHMDSKTAYESAKFGMWLFLATELLLFGVMFTCFAIYHFIYLKEFHAGSTHLDWRIGSINTVILLISSYFAAIAVEHAKSGQNKKVVRSLIYTIACGFVFLLIKSYEYYEKYSHGYFPTQKSFDHTFEKYKAFFGLYFSMTGIHALHVIIGMGLLFWVLLKAKNNRFSERYYTPVEIGALYWHLVDLIWIYLFPLLYLVG